MSLPLDISSKRLRKDEEDLKDFESEVNFAFDKHGKTPFAVYVAFFVFGLVNNIIFVIFLSAAVDMDISDGVILLADILPAVLFKLCFPYVQHHVSYDMRVLLCCVFSSMSLLIVANFQGVVWRILGICFASISSGAGEMTFLAMITLFPSDVIAAWGIGTGAAGILGALSYLVFTTILKISMESTLMVCSVLPIPMMLAYFLIKDYNVQGRRKSAEKEALESSFAAKFGVVLRMVGPYMLPLFLTFWAQYTINQGVSPHLLYPLENSPFTELRDYYVTFQFVYETGVFLSRSSVGLFRLKWTWIPCVLQIINLAILTTEALYPFMPSLWFTYAVVLWEGLLAGVTYINTFNRINTELEPEKREFAMSAATLSNTGGITAAALTSIFLAPHLCGFQVAQGRFFCQIR